MRAISWNISNWDRCHEIVNVSVDGHRLLPESAEGDTVRGSREK